MYSYSVLSAHLIICVSTQFGMNLNTVLKNISYRPQFLHTKLRTAFKLFCEIYKNCELNENFLIIIKKKFPFYLFIQLLQIYNKLANKKHQKN